METAIEQNRNYVERGGVIRLQGEANEVFPLFGPDREREWAVGWSPEPVFPGEVTAVAGAVFRTRHGGEAVWVVNRYDEGARVAEYTNFRNDDRVTRVRVVVEGDPDRAGWSVARVTYAICALSARGEQFLLHFTEEHYGGMMDEWEAAINKALAQSA